MTEEHGGLLGKWGKMRLDFMEQKNPAICQMMRKSGTLNDYLENYQSTFEIRAERILEEIRKKRGITEELWELNPFEWIMRDADAMVEVQSILRKEIER